MTFFNSIVVVQGGGLRSPSSFLERRIHLSLTCNKEFYFWASGHAKGEPPAMRGGKNGGSFDGKRGIINRVGVKSVCIYVFGFDL